MNKLYTAALLSVATLMTIPVSAQAFSELLDHTAKGETSYLDRQAREGHIVHGIVNNCHVFKNNKLVKKVPTCKVESNSWSGTGYSGDFNVYFIPSMQPIAIGHDGYSCINLGSISAENLKKARQAGFYIRVDDEVNPKTGTYNIESRSLTILQGKAAKSSQRQHPSGTLYCRKNSDGFEFCYDGYKAVSHTHKESATHKKLYKQYNDASPKIYETLLKPYIIQDYD